MLGRLADKKHSQLAQTFGVDKAARRIAQAAAKKREKDAANAEKNKTGVKLK